MYLGTVKLGSHRFAAGAQAAGHLRRIQALSQAQDNLCPETQVLQCLMDVYEYP